MPRFTPIEPIAVKTFWDILKWNMTADRARWPRRVEHGPTDKPPNSIQGSELRVSFVNHSTVLLQTKGLNILTDPVWSERVSPLPFLGPKRVHVPGIVLNDLPKIDIVLISHSHYDHLDIVTVRKLAKRDDPLFILPLGVDAIVEKHIRNARFQVMNWSDSFKVNEDLILYAEPVQHWSARSFGDRNKTLWTGFVMKFPEGNVYYAGDTGYATGKVFKDTFVKHGPMRFAILPIGAYEPRWFMKDSHANPEEAVQIFQDIQADHALGVHHGTFRLTDEAIDAPVKDLEAALKKAGIPNEKFRALKPGQVWLID